MNVLKTWKRPGPLSSFPTPSQCCPGMHSNSEESKPVQGRLASAAAPSQPLHMLGESQRQHSKTAYRGQPPATSVVGSGRLHLGDTGFPLSAVMRRQESLKSGIYSPIQLCPISVGCALGQLSERQIQEPSRKGWACRRASLPPPQTLLSLTRFPQRVFLTRENPEKVSR